MYKQHHFDRNAAAFRQSAERQFAELNKAVRSLRANMSGLHRALHVPKPKGSRRYSKSVRETPSLLQRAGESSLGHYFASSFLSDIGLSRSGSFYPSSSQTTSFLMQSMRSGQRIM